MPLSIFEPEFHIVPDSLFPDPEPFPDLSIITDSQGRVMELNFLSPEDERPIPESPQDNEHVRMQLQQYFAGRRTQFELELAPRGTSFQLAVWRLLTEIPFGETRSYLQVATLLGKPTATRAVGAANGANPIVIVQPCHRVIGSNGTLTGFGGGLSAKARLLALEGAR